MKCIETLIILHFCKNIFLQILTSKIARGLPGHYWIFTVRYVSQEQKLKLYHRLKESLKPGGYFVLTDYFAESEELEAEYFNALALLKKEQGIKDSEFYHYDTPLTVEHEIAVLKQAGFSEINVKRNWGATYTLVCLR